MSNIVEYLATYYSLDELVEMHEVKPEAVIRWLIEEDLIDLTFYREEDFKFE